MTRLLSHDRYAQARTFLLHSARPLEAALFRYRFEEGGADAVYAELARFQNPDGGFGHALEPDLQSPASSVLATTTALQRLRMLQAPAHHPLVNDAIHYLVASYDANFQSWPLVPRQAEDAPHAPWWNQEGLAERFGTFAINPRAEVLGYLHEFAGETEPKAATLRDTLTPIVFQGLLENTDKLSGDAFLCCQRLVDSPRLPSNMAADLQRWLLRMADTAVATDPRLGLGTCCCPCRSRRIAWPPWAFRCRTCFRIISILWLTARPAMDLGRLPGRGLAPTQTIGRRPSATGAAC